MDDEFENRRLQLLESGYWVALKPYGERVHIGFILGETWDRNYVVQTSKEGQQLLLTPNDFDHINYILPHAADLDALLDLALEMRDEQWFMDLSLIKNTYKKINGGNN